MADLDAAVTDTHALLFHAAGGRGLGPKAAAVFRAAEERRTLVYVPMAVMWEATLLARAGKVNLRRTARGFFGDLFTNPAYQPFALTAEQVFAADELRFNRDPFDALIVAAAQELDLPLITRDADIHQSAAVKVVW
ncbi:MAG: type II toxin-antitoxin system VapC family toxin [Vicinamibacterales bacterium]